MIKFLLSKLKKTVIVSILLLMSSISFAQKWVEMMNDPNVNFYTVQKEAEKYFSEVGTGRGTGYKIYKRWEYEMQFHIDAKGNRIDPVETIREYNNFRARTGNMRVGAYGDDWKDMGPTYWSRTSGWNPGVGRVKHVVVDPKNSNILYIASVGGAWKSTNGGTSWIPLTDNLPRLECYSIVVDPVNSNIVYLGSNGVGLYKSTDGGVSWNAINSGFPTNTSANKIIIRPDNANTIFVASGAGIYRSTNAGASWSQVASGGFNDIEFKPNDYNMIYACGNTFYRSTNGGSNFSQITNGIGTSGRSFIAVTPANPNYVYMLQARGNEFGYVFRSTDSGASFSTRVTGNASSGTNYFGYEANGTGTGGQAFHDMALCVSPSNAEEVHIAGIICWRSLNGGISFSATTEWAYPNGTGYNHADVHALEYIGNTIYSGSDGGIFRSTDRGDNWTDLSRGLSIRQFYRISCARTDVNMVAGGAQDNGHSIIKSGNWIDWLGADGMDVVIDPNNANIAYACIQNGGLYKTTNGGQGTASVNKPAGNGNWVTPLTTDPGNGSIVYIGYSELFKSTNGGSSWTQISSFGTSGGLNCVTVAPSNGNYIYASKGGTLYVTKNGGASWTNISAGLSGNITSITVHSSSPDKVAISTSNGSGKVYKSSNAGASWTNIHRNLPNISANSVVYQDGGDEGLYVGMDVGIYYTDNTLAEWVPFMSNMPNIAVYELEIHQSGRKIRAATHGRGLWESPLYTKGVVASTGLVTVYKDCNYTGFSTGLDVGDYTLAQLQAKGVLDNDISSLKITQGYKAILFDGDNFAGTSIEITADNSCLVNASGNWNDRVTSIRIRPNGDQSLSGIYILQNRNSGLILDVNGGTGALADGIGLIQSAAHENTNQQFNFEHLGDGVYKISAMHSGKVVDIDGIKFENGVKVQQWTYFGSGNQQFIAVSTGDGYYKLIAKHSGKVIEVAGFSTNPGAAIQQWENTNQTSGMWKLNRPVAANGTGDGLAGSYFNGMNFETPRLSRKDGSVNVDWGTGSPDASVNSDQFSVRWTGQVQPRYYGTYRFFVTSDDGCRLWVNNQLVVDKWSNDGGTEVSGTITLEKGQKYDIRLEYFENGGGAKAKLEWSSPIQVREVIPTAQLFANPVPSVSISAPANNSSFSAPAGFAITANASDNGSVTKVDFYNGNTLVGSDNTSPYSVNVSNLSAGNYTLKVIAFDNSGAFTISSNVAVSVVSDPLIGNGDGLSANYFNGMNFGTLRYSTKDATLNMNWGNGSPNAAVNVDQFSARWTGQVQPKYSGAYTFYITSDNGRRVWVNNQLIIDQWVDNWDIEYSGTITLTAQQKYDIRVELFENNGGANIKLEWSSAQQAREVVPTSQLYSNPLPVITVSSNATSATAPASFTFTATANDGDGISKVDFYNGTTLLGSDNTSPYNFTWSNVAVGSYDITAMATDNKGGVTLSSSVNVKSNNPVNSVPSVSISAPANNANYNAPANITISANASDSDGSVSKVDFYNGTTLIGSDNTSPYSVNWNNVAAGTYSITARATDNAGAVTSSSAITVKVNTVTTDPCTSVAQYIENGGYVDGSIVKNAGSRYKCKPYPYTGWCNGAAWAYAPGTGLYWGDAWDLVGSCGAKVSQEDAANTILYPNPTSGILTLQLNEKVTVAVYNTMGVEVLPSVIIDADGTLDMSSLTPGIYMVKIDRGYDIITQTVMKK